MIVDTIQLEENYVNVKNLQKEMSLKKRIVSFDNSNVSNVIPEGYMTVDQFRTEAKISLTKLLNERGIY